jgi:hypothetical protein
VAASAAAEGTGAGERQAEAAGGGSEPGQAGAERHLVSRWSVYLVDGAIGKTGPSAEVFANGPFDRRRKSTRISCSLDPKLTFWGSSQKPPRLTNHLVTLRCDGGHGRICNVSNTLRPRNNEPL